MLHGLVCRAIPPADLLYGGGYVEGEAVGPTASSMLISGRYSAGTLSVGGIRITLCGASTAEGACVQQTSTCLYPPRAFKNPPKTPGSDSGPQAEAHHGAPGGALPPSIHAPCSNRVKAWSFPQLAKATKAAEASREMLVRAGQEISRSGSHWECAKLPRHLASAKDSSVSGSQNCRTRSPGCSNPSGFTQSEGGLEQRTPSASTPVPHLSRSGSDTSPTRHVERRTQPKLSGYPVSHLREGSR
jgi:hypothetical protein